MTWPNRYTRREPVFTDAGSRIKRILSPEFDKDGNFELVQTGQEDLYGFIQSYKDSTDLHIIMQRFANGEVDVLAKTQGFYADVTSMPTTFAEMLNCMIQGEHYFDRLPIEVKQRFDNSFSKWMASMDDLPAWLEKMNWQQQPEPEPEPEGGAQG